MKVTVRDCTILVQLNRAETRMIFGTKAGKFYSLPSDPDERELLEVLSRLHSIGAVISAPRQTGVKFDDVVFREWMNVTFSKN